MSFRATAWVEERGFLGSFAIYAGVLAVVACFLPVFYVFGKRVRRWTTGTVESEQIMAEKKGSYMQY